MRRLRADGLPVTAIARRLGISKARVYELLDPNELAKARARKRRYDGVCVDCGAQTRNGGKAVPPKRCQACSRQHQHDTRRWTPDAITAAMRAWGERHGRAPVASDWRRTGMHHPTASTVVGAVGWNAALRAAGFAPSHVRGPGATGHGGLTPQVLADTIAAYERLGSLTAAARVLGVSIAAVKQRLRKAGHPTRRASGKLRRDGDRVTALTP